MIKLWGNIAPSGDANVRNIDVLSFNLNYHHIGFSISIVGFYLFPFIFFLKNIKKDLFNILANKEIYLSIILLAVFLIYFLFYYDLENFFGMGRMGGGVFLKFTTILIESIILQKIILSLIFLFSWILILIFSERNFLDFTILTLFPFLTIFISPALFQEYFDPLIYFLFLVYIKKIFIFNLRGCIFLFSYFSTFLTIALIYYK